MKGVWKHFLLAGLLALILYAVAYSWIEHLRQRKGGWRVTFASDVNGQPEISVAQPALHLANVRFRFLGERITATNFRQTIMFDRPITNAPFGQVLFIDTTFLPGTVTFDFFGHEVELLPRVLVVNRREVPWRADALIELRPEEKLSAEVRKRSRKAD